MNDIELMQYRNLRAGFSLLIDSILGKDYYNMCMDTYHCDLECFSDIINAYNNKIFKKIKNPFTDKKCEEIIENSINSVGKQNENRGNKYMKF